MKATKIVFSFGDVHEEFNLTISREAVYHTDTDTVVIVDTLWDGNEDKIGQYSIKSDTLTYEGGCTRQPPITLEQYDEIVNYVKQVVRKH